MGTSATIIIKDEWSNQLLLNRGSDGYPDIVIPEIKEVIKAKKDSWSGSEIGCFASSLIGWYAPREQRLPTYTVALDVREDDGYQFYLFYSKKEEAWAIQAGDIPTPRNTLKYLEKGISIICQTCFNESKYMDKQTCFCETCQTELRIVLEKDDFDFKINGEYKCVAFLIKEEGQ